MSLIFKRPVGDLIDGPECGTGLGACNCFSFSTNSTRLCNWGPGACFSKVPKLFGRISCDIILYVSSKRRRLEARNFAVIFIFIPFTTHKKTSFTE